MALTALGTMAASSHAAPYVPDPGSEAYASAVFADGDLQVAEDGSVTGDVHGNAGVILISGTVIDGDLSAVGAIDLGGAVVTGSVTSPVPPRQPPALPTGSEATLLAGRVFEGDHVFPDGTVVDDLVYVAGTARFEGSVDGVGTVIAGVEIRFDNSLPHAPVVLDAGTRMSFVSLGDLWVGQGRSLRGLLLSAGIVELHKELDFEGVVVAGADARMSAGVPLLPRWVGAWMALTGAPGADLGSFRVLEIDPAGRALLEGAAGVTSAAGFSGEYRFDAVEELSGSGIVAGDPVIVGSP